MANLSNAHNAKGIPSTPSKIFCQYYRVSLDKAVHFYTIDAKEGLTSPTITGQLVREIGQIVQKSTPQGLKSGRHTLEAVKGAGHDQRPDKVWGGYKSGRM